MSRTPEYHAWQAMKKRCRNPTDPRYRDYGARGIDYCAKWEDFLTFYSEMGPRPEGQRYSLDRINNNEGYSKENCRWATPREQQQNIRSNKHITYLDETKCISEWARELGVNRGLIIKRLKRGWSVEKALSLPSERKTK